MGPDYKTKSAGKKKTHLHYWCRKYFCLLKIIYSNSKKTQTGQHLTKQLYIIHKTRINDTMYYLSTKWMPFEIHIWFTTFKNNMFYTFKFTILLYYSSTLLWHFFFSNFAFQILRCEVIPLIKKIITFCYCIWCRLYNVRSKLVNLVFSILTFVFKLPIADWKYKYRSVGVIKIQHLKMVLTAISQR